MWLPVILALLIAAAGWHYAFYSKAASGLAGVEAASSNRLRVRLRRINGCLMIGLGGLFYVGSAALDQQWRPRTIGLLLLGMMVLLTAVAALAMVDLTLTRRLRQDLRQRRRGRPNADAPGGDPGPSDR